MDRRFVLLLACFLLSGFAALLYQTAWTRELSFVFGTSELAVAAVLGAYMGGLALGAAAAARIAIRLRRPVLVYGILELGIAVSALLVPTAIGLINSIYVGWVGGGAELPEGGATFTTLFQIGAAFAVLLPPTALMGATLPLLARHAVRSQAEIGSRVGILYAINTAGAIVGTLCAAFWLMPELGLEHTVWVGASLNGVVFVLAALLARSQTSGSPPTGQTAAPVDSMDAARWMLPAIAVSGAVSFTYEVLWTRLLGHVLGGSLDAFATMLASFLLGIALGSAFAARIATTRARAAFGFGLAQLGIAVTSYGAYSLADALPRFSIQLGAGPGAALASAALAAATLLPITLCIGATFPFAVRLLARTPEQAASATARAYAWNTVGAIFGALAAGFVLLPELGFEGTLGLGVAANLGLAAFAALLSRPRHTRLALVTVALGILLVLLPIRPPWTLLRTSPLTKQMMSGEIVYAAVGRSSSVMLLKEGPFFRLASNGLPEAKIDRAGMLPLASVVHWLGLLPSIVRPEARELLVVGLGGGSVLESIPSSVESIDVIELEPEVVSANRLAAPDRAIDPLADPRVHVHVGDARGALQLTSKRYDAVVSQPSHPWTAGASHLYTREFFSLVRNRLQPGGVFVQWIGLAFVDEALIASLTATLLDVFGHVEIYQVGAGMGVLFAASTQPLGVAESARRALQAAPEDLARFGLHRPEDILAVRVLDTRGARSLSQDALLNTDDHNRLASRSSRLGDRALNGQRARKLWRGHADDAADLAAVDRSALIRKLSTTKFSERATALTRSDDESIEEVGLGWIELVRGRPKRAARHFMRGLELSPSASDAVVGLVASREFDLARLSAVAGISEADLDPRLVAVMLARPLAGAEDWPAVANLEKELDRIAPGEALFEEASRLRIGWRLAGQESAAAAEAQSIAETLLVRKWSPEDALLRARAASLAKRPEAAWGSLSRVIDVLPRHPQRAKLLRSVHGIIETLPARLEQDLLVRLESIRERVR